MEDYRESCPDQVEKFKKEVKWLNVRLMQDLEDQFKEDVKVNYITVIQRRVLWAKNSVPVFADLFPHSGSRNSKTTSKTSNTGNGNVILNL